MKSLLFEKLELMSTLGKRARTIKLHPRLTVIAGDNDVGKSSVIKSLYWAFGTRCKMHPKWIQAKVKARVTFSIDGQRYSVLRDGSRIAVFDGDSGLLLSTTSVTKILGPYLARLLDFGLVFSNRSGEPETPPPAFAFLPFYIDQDAGWVQALESFDDLGQYANWRKAVIEFHSGIRPNAYYKLQAEKRGADLARSELLRDRAAVEKAIGKLGLEPTFTGLELSEADYDASINRLLHHLHNLRVSRQSRAVKLAAIVEERATLNEQMAIAQAAMQEFTKDFTWLSSLEEKELLCPTCGTVHQNNFSNRFAILDDREACSEFIRSARERLFDLTDQVTGLQSSIQDDNENIAQLTHALDERRGDLTLREVIECEGRQKAAGLFTSQLGDLSEQISQYSGKIAEIDQAIKALQNKKRKEEIEAYYARHMIAFLKALDVTNINYDSVTKIDRRINETGSDQPRAVLAYHLALMRTVHEFSSSVTAPMVIDSPNQQDQDAKNVAAMIELIISSRPKHGQTILGTVSLHDHVVQDGVTITFAEKSAVLRTDEFEATAAALAPLLEQM